MRRNNGADLGSGAVTRTIAGGGTAELEVGKVYLNGLGMACRIVSERHEVFRDETGRAYTRGGYDARLNLDLIQELEPACPTPPK